MPILTFSLLPINRVIEFLDACNRFIDCWNWLLRQGLTQPTLWHCQLKRSPDDTFWQRFESYLGVEGWIAIGDRNIHRTIFQFMKAITDERLSDAFTLMLRIDRNRSKQVNLKLSL